MPYFFLFSPHSTFTFINALSFQIQEKISKKEVLFGTIDTWLVWKLTGGEVHATDGSNACVTGFFDIFKVHI